jgi:hypothetical protein
VRLQFSLRSLLCAIAIIAIALVIPRHRSLMQWYAVQRLGRSGVLVELTAEQSQQSFAARLVFGDNKYDSVGTIAVDGIVLSQADASRLSLFPRIHDVWLHKCPTTDTVLSYIGRLQSVRFLGIDDATISSQGIASICDMPNLSILHILNVRLEDADLSALQALPSLRSVSLSGREIDDDVLHDVSRCNKLDFLGMTNVSVTDDGLRQLDHVNTLTRLVIRDSEITGAGLMSLSNLPALMFLDLDGSAIDDSGLESVKLLTQLETLRLVGTNVSRDGVERVKVAIPACLIVSDFGQGEVKWK